MLSYRLRFLNVETEEMIYDCGISPNQKPLRKLENGLYEELEGTFTPMIDTGQKAINGTIWEADIIQAETRINIAGIPSIAMVVGIMQYDQSKGAFFLNLLDAPTGLTGVSFSVQNSKIIGCALKDKEILKMYEKTKQGDKND